MILQEGNKILIAHRRLFEKDQARFFVGEVNAYEAGIVKATGHSFLRDMMGGRLVEKAEPRTKILSLSSGTYLVYQLPDNLLIDSLTFTTDDGTLCLTDGAGFTMNLSENPHGGRF